jgi:hypothetical protein
MRIISGVYYNHGEDGYTVGHPGVTKIVETEKNGHMAALPYLAVYNGDNLIAELCQHNVTLVTYRNVEE